jgi:hypothetical protein
MAQFYDGVLKLFGYNSFTLDFGLTQPSAFTHVTVIVPLFDGSVWNYYVFDPTTNSTFHDPTTGAYLTLQDMMARVAANPTDPQIAVQGMGFPTRHWLSSTPLYLPGYTQVGFANGYWIYSNLTYSLAQMMTDAAYGLVPFGYTAGLTGLIKALENNVFALGYSGDTTMLQQFVQTLTADNVPVDYYYH